jgi:RNA polymerase sigma factor (sigma-70 family)
VAAFEALYERYHLQLLSFSRHMVGRVHDAEDVVQHAFIAADRTFRSGKAPKSVRAWLYTVARNRCVSLLRARREEHDLPDAGVPSTENLAADVEQRADLRELLDDLRTLPDDQRAALLLSELGDLSHAEVGEVIGVRASKVKALVFQARQNLMAAAVARAIPCRSIREELAVATGASLRRKHLRNHLVQCDECAAYSARVRAQRASLAAILPVVPTVALRDGVLGALGGGVAAAGAGVGGTSAGLGILAAKSTAAKVLAIATLGGAAAGGGTVAVSAIDASPSERSAEREMEKVRPAPAPAPAGAAPGAGDRSGDSPPSAAPRAGDPASARDGRRGTAEPGERARKRGDRPSQSRRDAAPGQTRRDEITSEAPGSRGRALGKAKQQVRERPAAPAQSNRQERARIVAPGRVKKEGATAPKANATPPEEKMPTLPAQAKPAEPAPVETPPVPVAEAKPGNGAANAQAAEGVPTE